MKPSINELRGDWLQMRAALAARCPPLEVGNRIATSNEFAASNWQSKLHAWCRDLDEMLLDYPADDAPRSDTRPSISPPVT